MPVSAAPQAILKEEQTVRDRLFAEMRIFGRKKMKSRGYVEGDNFLSFWQDVSSSLFEIRMIRYGYDTIRFAHGYEDTIRYGVL
jgi:hypothetical protein